MDRTASQRAGLAQGAQMAEWIFLLAFSIGCAVVVVRRQRVLGHQGPAGRTRGPGWGFLLLPLALLLHLTTGGGPLTLLLVLAAGGLVVLKPTAARRLLPYSLIVFGLYGLKLVVLSSYTGFDAAYFGLPFRSGRDHWLLPEALAFLAVGTYLAIRWGRGVPRLALLLGGRTAWGRGRAGASRRPPWNLLLIPVAGLAAELAWPAFWFGYTGDRILTGLAVLGLLTLAVILLLKGSKRVPGILVAVVGAV